MRLTDSGSALGRRLLRMALETRRAHDVAPTAPICVYDLAEAMGVDVRFLDIPSLEGLYKAGSRPVIMLAADRPAGRQAFTCAHELGHHLLGHGTRLDELVGAPAQDRRRGDQEWEADLFASFLLMPNMAVCHGFTRRGWRLQECTPLQVYTVAGWLGVSYEALVRQLCRSLSLIDRAREAALLKVQPRDIRAQVLGRSASEALVVVDTDWVDSTVDVEVGDLLALPDGCRSEGSAVGPVQAQLAQAQRRGIGRVIHDEAEWAVYVRVRPHRYVGLGRWRHEEDDDDG